MAKLTETIEEGPSTMRIAGTSLVHFVKRAVSPLSTILYSVDLALVNDMTATRHPVLGDMPLDEKRQRLLDGKIHPRRAPLQLGAVRPTPAHRGRLQTQTCANGIQVVGTDANGVNTGSSLGSLVRPVPKRRALSFGWVDDGKQLDVAAAKRDDAIGGTVTGMTPSLHRAEAETIFEASGGLVEVADTYDQVVDHRVHMTSLADRQLS